MLSAPLETDHRLAGVMLDAVSDRYAVDIFSCFIPFVLLSLYLRTVAIRQPFFVSLSLSLQPVAIRQSFFVLLASFYCGEAHENRGEQAQDTQLIQQTVVIGN